MNTNHIMLKELLKKYHPNTAGILSLEEHNLIQDTLELEEMDILALRNLRDYTVASMSHSDKPEDWDRMSAIVCVIDEHILRLGGEV